MNAPGQGLAFQTPQQGGAATFSPFPFLNEAVGGGGVQNRVTADRLTGLPFVSGQTFQKFLPSEREAYLSTYGLLGVPQEDTNSQFFNLTRGFGNVPSFRNPTASTFRRF